MFSNFLIKTAQRVNPTQKAASLALTMRASPMMAAGAMRSFGHTKYKFDDEDWDPNVHQVSLLHL